MHTKGYGIYMQFGIGYQKSPKFNEQTTILPSVVSMPTCDIRRRRMRGIKNGGDVRTTEVNQTH